MLSLGAAASARGRRRTCLGLLCWWAISRYKGEGFPKGADSVNPSNTMLSCLFQSWFPHSGLPGPGTSGFILTSFPGAGWQAFSAIHCPYLDLGTSWITQAGNLNGRCLPFSSGKLCLAIETFVRRREGKGVCSDSGRTVFNTANFNLSRQ